MKKVLLFIFLLLIPILVYADDSCSEDDIVINSINLDKVFGRAKELNDASIDGKKVNLDLYLTKLGDSVEYSFNIKNVSDNDYLIDMDSLINNSDYLDYNVVIDSDIIKAGEEKNIKLIITYKDLVPDNLYDNDSYDNSGSFVINMINEENPNTKDYIYLYGIILLISLCLLIYFVIKKNKYTKELLLIISCSFLIPISVYALCKCNIELDVKVQINKYEPNNMISVYPLLEDGTRDISVERAHWKYRGLIENITLRIDNNSSDLNIANNCGDNNDEECSFDISESQNKTVMSYLVLNENNLYDCFIVADDYIYAPADSYMLFGGTNDDQFENLKSINNLEYLLTDNVTDMAHMFFQIPLIENIDVSHFNTSKVIYMYGMFGHCTNLLYVDVSNFDMSNVRNVSTMFVNDKNIDNLDVSKWNTSSIKNMYKVFRDCPKLHSLDLTGWDTSNVTNFAYMFSGDTSLTGLDISNFDTSKATDISHMFEYINPNNDIDFNLFDVSNVTNMEGVFRKTKFTSIDISGWDTSKVTSMRIMFNQCNNLTTIYVGQNWSTDNVTDSYKMFFETSNIVGQNGTVYNSSKIDKKYARVDQDGAPGYLTLKTNS